MDADDVASSSSELKSDFTSYLQHVSQNKRPQRNTPSFEHSYSASVGEDRDRLHSSIKTLFIRRADQNANVTDVIDVESVEKDPPLLTYRPSAESVPVDLYRNSRPPRDPETWEQDINKSRWSKQENNLFERAMSILYSNCLSRLTFEGTNQEDVQKIIATDKSVAEFHNLFTNMIGLDTTLSRWLHKILFSNLPDDYLTSYSDILAKLKLIVPSFVNGMIAPNTRGRSKEEIKSKTINLKEPVDPFNNMLTAYPPLKLPKKPVIVLVPDFPGYCIEPNTRTHDWMNALAYLAEMDVASVAKKYSRKEEVNLEASLSAMVDTTRIKILSIKKKNPSRPIFLAGVGVSAAIACQVAVLEKVEGLVCIGLIINSSEVKRGYAGDCILDIECPTLFVSGQLSIFSPVLDMEDLRAKLKCRTSHILVGGANNELVMNHSTKMREAVTQNLVDRCVLEEIGNFLKEILDLPQKYKSSLFKKKTSSKLLARPNIRNQERMISVDNKSPKRQLLGNRKINKMPCTSTVTSAMMNDRELMPPPPFPIFQSETSNSKKKNKEHMIPDNNQSPKKQMANRKAVKIPCTSTVTSEFSNIVKDQEFMPPPSSFLTQEYPIQHGKTSNSKKKNKEHLIPDNNQSPKKKMANHKAVKIPCTSTVTSEFSNIVKDQECMPPPSSFLTQKYPIQHGDTSISFNSNQLEDSLSIPNLENQKLSEISELLQGLESFDINLSQTTLQRSLASSPLIFNPEKHHFVACKDFQSQGNQTNDFDLDEITADQILAMPIVFVDKAPQVETNQKTENSSNLCTGSNMKQEVSIEKPIVKEDVNIAIRPEVFAENPCRQVLVRGELRDVIKEEPISDDEEEASMCTSVSTSFIPESFKIKQAAYNKVENVHYKTPKSTISSGYQTSVPSQNSGNIRFVNRLPMRPNIIRSIEGGAASQRSAPKTPSNCQSKDSNIIMMKRATELQLQLHRNKQMATKQTFKKNK